MQKRRRFKQTISLEDRLEQRANELRAQARLLPPSHQRDDLLRQARRTETAVHISGWLTSPGLKSPT